MKNLNIALGCLYIIAIVSAVVSVLGIMNCLIPTGSLMWLFFRIFSNSAIGAFMLAMAIKYINLVQEKNRNKNQPKTMGFTQR